MMKIPPTAITIALLQIFFSSASAIQKTPQDIQSQNDLSAEEMELLKELEDPSFIYESVENVFKKTQSELDSLDTIQVESIPAFLDETNALLGKIKTLKNETSNFLQEVKNVNEMEIEAFGARLKASVEDELRRRKKLPTAEDSNMTEEAWPKGLSMEEIKKKIVLQDMTQSSMLVFQQYVSKALGDKYTTALNEYLTKCKKEIEEKEIELTREFKRIFTKEEKSTGCVKDVEAAQKVLDSLVALKCDGNQSDLLTRASVVYGHEWTSDSYQPHIEGGSNAPEELKLGDASVRKYIPEDWEMFLPAGWEDWDISIMQKLISSPSPQNLLPPYIWNSLPAQFLSLVEAPFQKAVPAPTETILDPNNHLGSCWKMAGRSGKVTLRLQKPAVIGSVTIDHYPWIPAAHNPKEYVGHVTSATRFIRIIGYPSCDDECNTQGFDGEQPINYGSFEYKIDSSLFFDEEDLGNDNIPTSTSQTFSLRIINDEEDSIEPLEGGCSAVKPTCEGPSDEEATVVEAITVFVDENWGYPDYTCIYRIRVNEK